MPEVKLFFDEMGELNEFIVEARFFVLSQEYIAVLKRYELDTYAQFLRVEIDENGHERYDNLTRFEREKVEKEYHKIRKLIN